MSSGYVHVFIITFALERKLCEGRNFVICYVDKDTSVSNTVTM